MGHFVSVRGWLEIDKQMEPGVLKLVKHFSENAPTFGITSEEGEFYLQGWVFPEKHINWTKYIYYGADVRVRGLDFLKEHFKEIAEKIWLMDTEIKDYVTGFIFVDDESGKPFLFWKLEEGKLTEVNKYKISHDVSGSS